MSKTLSEQLRIKAGMMQMGEKIAWGSDTALMEQAADEIDRLEAELAQLRKEREAGGFFCPGTNLRDYLAAKAVAVVLAQCKEFPGHTWRIVVAMSAYKMADAMLAARSTEK